MAATWRQARRGLFESLPACLSISARGALRLTTPHSDLLLRSEIEAWAGLAVESAD